MFGWHDTRLLASIVGEKEAAALKQAFGYTTVEELLSHYPRKYAAHGLDLNDGTVAPGDTITCLGTIVDTNERRLPDGQVIYTVRISGDSTTPYTTNIIEASFFNARWIPHTLVIGARGMFTGTLSYFRDTPQLQHPEYMVMASPGAKIQTSSGLKGLISASSARKTLSLIQSLDYIPIYPARKKMPSWRILGAIAEVLKHLPDIAEPLGNCAPKEMVTFDEAIRGIHFPGVTGPQPYLHRMRYNEALELALVMALRRADTNNLTAKALAPSDIGMRSQLLAALPYSLTTGQQQVIAEISNDLSRKTPMTRMLQGEVGSGKTIVSLLAMLQACDAGVQCALLAPTEVLAQQHSRSITQLLHQAGVAAKVVLLTSSLNTYQRQQALLDIVSGEANIVIGTHSLIQETVEFYHLGFYVVDEQHRFGVQQRDTLRAKAPVGLSPHMLVMTATPIPRTIAMTAFGDLSQSILSELPGGRRPIKSYVVPDSKINWVNRAYERIREEVARQRQAYIVCPRVKGTGGVEEIYEHLHTGVFNNLNIALLHGQLPAEDKEHIMKSFAHGEIDVLIATTVIEVGIDVPNATVMMIREAERFGISQLHQLRGRVGRGGNDSICLLHTAAEPDSDTYARIQSVAATTDGFSLAEIDLEYRQEGDVLGEQQSGMGRLRFIRLSKHRKIIEKAHEQAQKIVDKYPEQARALVVDIDDDAQGFLAKT
ncbi:ATP-dependent DNA helicase [Corynebacterium kutscheri]|uniref:ATP-dependent DNA helicase n=1 Tax=Corynebacterium kutscheri TaxID=35755 RepID=A0A0F6TDN1_9CORY|nr:ATP-dependent DNA helicase RecG [Corynebacterium kutscheri]AKE41074.1 ATP-dependent DNA helicase RecG [Corynebacterium kutscheri]VEH06964.1 ATP-dependent DNA helicase [Corynebacterium kutscheri]VEH09378.1 ATP-dependent DNA helicase [Corynebacterium kutscheri]VEH79459.1 ATP-dependent DNA helicase [Corynebacterium kutscheri]